MVLNDDYSLTIYYTDETSYTTTSIRGERGPQGPQGPQGAGIVILGSYNSVEELKAAHPIGSIGDGYLIKGELYVWDATLLDWKNVGTIQGPKGEPGTRGEDGVSLYHRWDGTTLTITSANGSSSVDLKGESGEVGPQGPAGP